MLSQVSLIENRSLRTRRFEARRQSGHDGRVDRSELAAAIHTASHLVGTFQLRSGRTASEYFDKYRFESDPVLLRAIAEHAADRIPPGTEVLAGLELGGVPIATALGLASGHPIAFARKAAKPYGTRQLAEGADVTGRRVLIVEDVITSGGQVVQSAADLRELGAIVGEVLCVVDRQEGAVENLAEHGLTAIALFTADELSAAAGGGGLDVADDTSGAG
jgi:orotate phosphoribosyltransferase